MANQKQMRELRELIMHDLMNTEFPGFTFEGIVTDGVLLYHSEADSFIVIKPIVKKEGFEAEEALQEYQDKLVARAEKDAEKAKKAAEREKKKKEKEE